MIDKVGVSPCCCGVDDLLDHVAENIRRERLLRRGAKFVVAVSGGLDWVVLLHVLHELAPAHQWELHVAHFNHGLRGRAATADQKFVERVAGSLSLPVDTEKADVQAWAQRQGVSIEMAARDLRHDFLARAASRRGARTVALAHHADDQVELFFLRLLRGAGSEGLSGMKWKGSSPAQAKVHLIRPLLDLSKETLIEYARAHHLKFREDASNASPEFLRNRVRGELLPLLEKHYQPGLRQVVLRQIEIGRAESEFMASSRRDLAQANPPVPWKQWPVALQRRHLQSELRQQGVNAGFDLIESLRLKENVPISMPGGRVFLRGGNGGVDEVKSAKSDFSHEELTVSFGYRKTSIAFSDLEIQSTFKGPTKFAVPKSRPGLEWFDADRVGPDVVLRHWREGDRFQPIGMKQSVKLQDLFTNQKIPPAKRRSLVVATTNQGVIWWVEGLRIGEMFKITSKTKRLLRWSWEARS